MAMPSRTEHKPGFIASRRGICQAMGDFMDQGKDFADEHDDQVDKGLKQAGDKVDDRIGGKYDDKIEKGVDEQRRTGEGDHAG
jgi:hypothetical protein